MKLKIVILDLELSRRQKRVLSLGLGVALAMATAVALADVPHAFVAGETLTADNLNQRFGYLEAGLADTTADVASLDAEVGDLDSEVGGIDADLEAIDEDVASLDARIPIITEWQTASSVGMYSNLHGIIPGQTTTAVYRRVGDTMQVRITTKIGAGFDGSAAGTYFKWRMPENETIDTAKLGNLPYPTLGHGQINRTGGTASKPILSVSGANLDPGYVAAVCQDGTNSGAAAPMTFVNGDQIDLVFEAPIVGWTLTGT